MHLHDDRSAWVVTLECMHAASLWHGVTQGLPAMMSCLPPTNLDGLGAADAWAADDTAGIGGWWCPDNGTADPRSMRYFYMELSPSMFPEWMGMRPTAEKDISFYEALAQLVLFVKRADDAEVKGPARAVTEAVKVRHLCDNMSAVGATNKLFSSAVPMCWCMQALSHHAAKRNARLHLCHIAGERNKWADMLSRFRQYGAFVDALPAANKVEVDVAELLCQLWPWRKWC